MLPLNPLNNAQSQITLQANFNVAKLPQVQQQQFCQKNSTIFSKEQKK